MWVRAWVGEWVTFCLSPGDKQFVCPPGDKHFLHTGGGGGTNIFHTQGGGQPFLYLRGGQTFLHQEGGGQTFFVGGGGSYDDVDEEIDVSEARRALKFQLCNRQLVGNDNNSDDSVVRFSWKFIFVCGFSGNKDCLSPNTEDSFFSILQQISEF